MGHGAGALTIVLNPSVSQEMSFTWCQSIDRINTLRKNRTIVFQVVSLVRDKPQA